VSGNEDTWSKSRRRAVGIAARFQGFATQRQQVLAIRLIQHHRSLFFNAIDHTQPRRYDNGTPRITLDHFARFPFHRSNRGFKPDHSLSVLPRTKRKGRVLDTLDTGVIDRLPRPRIARNHRHVGPHIEQMAERRDQRIFGNRPRVKILVQPRPSGGRRSLLPYSLLERLHVLDRHHPAIGRDGHPDCLTPHGASHTGKKRIAPILYMRGQRNRALVIRRTHVKRHVAVHGSAPRARIQRAFVNHFKTRVRRERHAESPLGILGSARNHKECPKQHRHIPKNNTGQLVSDLYNHALRPLPKVSRKPYPLWYNSRRMYVILARLARPAQSVDRRTIGPYSRRNSAY